MAIRVEIVLRMVWLHTAIMTVVRRLSVSRMLGVQMIVHHWWVLSRHHPSWALHSIGRRTTLRRHVSLLRSWTTHWSSMRRHAISLELPWRSSVLAGTHVGRGHSHPPLVLSVAWRHPVHSILMRRWVSTVHGLLVGRWSSETTRLVRHATLAIVRHSHTSWNGVSIVVDRGRRGHSTTHSWGTTVLATIIGTLRSSLRTTLAVVGLLRLVELSSWGRCLPSAVLSRLALLSSVAKSDLAL